MVENDSPSYGADLSRQLAEKMSNKIGQLFYEHDTSYGEEDKKNMFDEANK